MKDGRDQMIRQADLVWVFTGEMADRVRDRCHQVHVGRLPSFVEDHGWDLRSIDETTSKDLSPSATAAATSTRPIWR